MARLPGLFQRGVVYQLRVMVPLDLRPLYAGRSKLVRSLGTSDWREAERLGAQVRTDLLEEFAERRRALRPRPVADFLPGLGTTLGARVHRRLLRWDAQMRGDPALADLWLRFIDAFGFTTLTRLGHGPPAVPALPSAEELAELAPHSPFDGLTPAQLARLAELNSAADDSPDRPPAPRSLAALTVIADSEARRLGLLVDWQQAAARPLLHDCLRGWRAARAELVGRADGAGGPTPIPSRAAARSARSTLPRLREVFEQWRQAKPRKADTLRACERALALFEQRTGDTPVQAITRAQGDDFRAWLRTLGTSSKTAHERITWVKSLLVYAWRDLDLIPRHPWEGIDIEHRTEMPRKPWTDEELRAFFSLPLFNRHALPKAPKAGADAAYWIPLLGLHTGARLGELCQLRVVDVEAGKDGAFLRITEDVGEATFEPAAGFRRVPMHRELVRLGFLDYVAAMKRAGEVSLWPRLPMRKGKPAAYFSDWVNAFHREATENPKAPVFHGLRHTVRTGLLAAEVDRETIGRIMGHETGLAQAEKACTQVSDMELRAAVEALGFPAVKLRRVFRC